MNKAIIKECKTCEFSRLKQQVKGFVCVRERMFKDVKPDYYCVFYSERPAVLNGYYDKKE